MGNTVSTLITQTPPISIPKILSGAALIVNIDINEIANKPIETLGVMASAFKGLVYIDDGLTLYPRIQLAFRGALGTAAIIGMIKKIPRDKAVMGLDIMMENISKESVLDCIVIVSYGISPLCLLGISKGYMKTSLAIVGIISNAIICADSANQSRYPISNAGLGVMTVLNQYILFHMGISCDEGHNHKNVAIASFAFSALMIGDKIFRKIKDRIIEKEERDLLINLTDNGGIPVAPAAPAAPAPSVTVETPAPLAPSDPVYSYGIYYGDECFPYRGS